MDNNKYDNIKDILPKHIPLSASIFYSRFGIFYHPNNLGNYFQIRMLTKYGTIIKRDFSKANYSSAKDAYIAAERKRDRIICEYCDSPEWYSFIQLFKPIWDSPHIDLIYKKDSLEDDYLNVRVSYGDSLYSCSYYKVANYGAYVASMLAVRANMIKKSINYNDIAKIAKSFQSEENNASRKSIFCTRPLPESYLDRELNIHQTKKEEEMLQVITKRSSHLEPYTERAYYQKASKNKRNKKNLPSWVATFITSSGMRKYVSFYITEKRTEEIAKALAEKSVELKRSAQLRDIGVEEFPRTTEKNHKVKERNVNDPRRERYYFQETSTHISEKTKKERFPRWVAAYAIRPGFPLRYVYFYLSSYSNEVCEALAKRTVELKRTATLDDIKTGFKCVARKKRMLSYATRLGIPEGDAYFWVAEPLFWRGKNEFPCYVYRKLMKDLTYYYMYFPDSIYGQEIGERMAKRSLMKRKRATKKDLEEIRKIPLSENFKVNSHIPGFRLEDFVETSVEEKIDKHSKDLSHEQLETTHTHEYLDTEFYKTEDIDYTGCHRHVADALRAGKSILCHPVTSLDEAYTITGTVYVIGYDVNRPKPYILKGTHISLQDVRPVIGHYRIKPASEILKWCEDKGYVFTDSVWKFIPQGETMNSEFYPFTFDMIAHCGKKMGREASNYKWNPEWLEERL